MSSNDDQPHDVVLFWTDCEGRKHEAGANCIECIIDKSQFH